MSKRSEFVGVRLIPEEREKFEEFIEGSNEFDSISRFFHVLAHRYIATEDEEQYIDTEEIIEAVDTAVRPISEHIAEVEEHVISIDSNTRDDDKIDTLARDIYSSLPTHPDETGPPDFAEIKQSETTRRVSTTCLMTRSTGQSLTLQLQRRTA